MKKLATTYLADEHRHAKRNKVPHRPGVSVQVAARETLVRRVKEGVVLFRQENIRDGLPLLSCGVDARRIVRAGMQQEHRVLRSILQRRNKSIKIEPDRLRVVIRIDALLDADILKDGEMIGCMTSRGISKPISPSRSHENWG